jgi:hypothetical protein
MNDPANLPSRRAHEQREWLDRAQARHRLELDPARRPDWHPARDALGVRHRQICQGDNDRKSPRDPALPPAPQRRRPSWRWRRQRFRNTSRRRRRWRLQSTPLLGAARPDRRGGDGPGLRKDQNRAPELSRRHVERLDGDDRSRPALASTTCRSRSSPRSASATPAARCSSFRSASATGSATPTAC